MAPKMTDLNLTNLVHYSRSAGRSDFERLWSSDDDDVLSLDGDSDDDSQSACSSICSQSPLHMDERRVRFSDEDAEHSIIHLNDFSESERSACWWSSEERAKSTAERQKIIDRLEMGKPCKNTARNEMTYRGLECWTTDGGKELNDNIDAVIRAVIDEQDRLWQAGTERDGALLLAAKSRAVTGSSVQRAVEIGQKDEVEARNQYNDKQRGDVTVFWYRPEKRGNRRLRKVAADAHGLTRTGKKRWITAIDKASQQRQA